MRRSGAGGIASRTMGSGVHVKQQGTENNDRRFYFPTISNTFGNSISYYSRTSRSDMLIDNCSSSINRISRNTFGNSSSYYRRTVPLIMHRPNGGSEGHLIVVLTLLGGTRRNRHPRPTLRWAACTSASGAEDSGIWPRSVPLHSGSKVHATAVVSMATATTTA